MEGWVIDRDYFYDPDDNLFADIPSRVGYGQVDAATVEGEAEMIFGRRITVETDLKVNQIDNPVRFRLMDEDGEIHYGGAISRSWLDGDECFCFAPQRFAETDSGATIMEYKDENNEWEML